MAKILNNPSGNTDRVSIVYSPEEILPKVFDVEKGMLRITDAIKTIAWKDLWANAPQLLKDRELKYGNTTVLDGNYVVTFYEEMPVGTPTPEAG